MIDLHYWPTPNGKKVTIQLEECGLPYRIVPCRIEPPRVLRRARYVSGTLTPVSGVPEVWADPRSGL